MTRRTLFGFLVGAGTGAALSNTLSAGTGAALSNTLSHDASEKPPHPEAPKITFHPPSRSLLPPEDPSTDIAIARGEDGYLWIRQHGQWKRMVS